MNIGRKRIKVNPKPKNREIYPEQDIDETLLHNTDPSNFEDPAEDVWKYGDRIVYMGYNQLDCHIIGYIGIDNKLTRRQPHGFKYGPSPCPEDVEDKEDEEDEEQQYGGKKSKNRKSRKRKSRKSKKKMSKKRKTRKMKPRKKKSTRKH